MNGYLASLTLEAQKRIWSTFRYSLALDPLESFPPTHVSTFGRYDYLLDDIPYMVPKLFRMVWWLDPPHPVTINIIQLMRYMSGTEPWCYTLILM